MEFSEDQKLTLSEMTLWFKKKEKPYLILAGYAGTGKTTLVTWWRKWLQERRKLRVAFVSYTGKAALVLKDSLRSSDSVFKGDYVGTIHSLLYSPLTNEREEIIGWEKKPLKEFNFDLIILDEASMVDAQIWEDIRSIGIPILAVGDHGQLPPISGQFNLLDKPDLKLEKIHRQAEDNPIIYISELAREKGEIPSKKYADKVIKFDRTDSDSYGELDELLLTFDEQTLVLCGYNKTRVELNKSIRGMKGFDSPTPQVGDRLICLRNNHKKQIFNGQIGTLEKIGYLTEEARTYEVEISFDTGQRYMGSVLAEQFGAEKPLNYTSQRRKTAEVDLFDFGYATTVHKAQGSQAKRVILLEERFPRMDEQDWSKWLYTAVTRAQEELYIF
ncbi:MAG: ATP-dependent DNA helicase [Candidatus Dojkabacteria bacterium]